MGRALKKENIYICALVLSLLLPVLLSLPLTDAAPSFFLSRVLFFFSFAAFLYAGKGTFPSGMLKDFLAYISTIGLAVISFLEFCSFYLQGVTFNYRFMYHFRWDVLWPGMRAYPLLPLVFVLYLALTAVTLHLVLRSGPCPTSSGFRLRRFLPFLLLPLAFVLVDNPAAQFAQAVRAAYGGANVGGGMRSAVHFSEVDADYSDRMARQAGFRTDLLPPDAVQAEPGKNLVFIYLESIEANYLDESIFPGLAPNLSRLKGQALSLENFQQKQGSGWTMGGIFSSQCGLPLAVSDFGNEALLGFQDKGLTCLGDVLSRAGYRQTFIGGAEHEFAGKGRFLKSHGYDEVLGRNELAGELPADTKLNGWGLYDEQTFAIARQKFDELAAEDEPFNLTLLTLDTHHPKGMPSPSMPDYPGALDETMLDAVHATDRLVGDFLRHIKASPAFEETVVFIMSDHLAMRNTVSDLLSSSSGERQLIGMALNSPFGPQKVEAPVFHVDVASSLLDFLEVEHDARFALGESLDGRFERLERGGTPFDSGYAGLQLVRAFMHSQFKDEAVLCQTHGVNLHVGDYASFEIEGGEYVPNYQGNARLPGDGEFYVVGFSPQRKLMDSFMVGEGDLLRLIAEKPDYYQMVVGPARQLPSWLAEPEGAASGRWFLYLGKPASGRPGYLTFFDPGERQLVGRQICRDTLAHSADVDEERLDELLVVQTQGQDGLQPRSLLGKSQVAETGVLDDDVTFVVSSATFGHGDSNLRMNSTRVLSGRRGLNLAVLDADGKAVVSEENFDTYGQGRRAVVELLQALDRVEPEQTLVLFAHDAVTPGSEVLPPSLGHKLEGLGARAVEGLGWRQPYILVVNAANDLVLEKRRKGASKIELSVPGPGA